MRALREAAALRLERGLREQSAVNGRIERIMLEVATDAGRELVSLALREGLLVAVCSCGAQDCAHLQVALEQLVEPAEARQPSNPAQRPLPTDRRTVTHTVAPASADSGLLAEILRDLVAAVVRSGLCGGLSPSIEEVLGRLCSAAPTPLPLGMSRFIGRLKRAIVERDVDEAARVLSAASQLSDDLSASPRAPLARTRVRSWLGSLRDEGVSGSPITDLRLIELAREWLPGVDRIGLERRYMIDPGTGLIYREERSAGVQEASLGPCPRKLTELLAFVEDTVAPRSVRLSQYAVTPVVEAELLEQVAQLATTRFEDLVEHYRTILADSAGLGEPFAVVAPAGGAVHADSALSDAAGQLLALVGPDRRQTTRSLQPLIRGGELLFVAGRLLDRDGSLGLLPLSAAIRRHGLIHYAQL